MGKSERSKTSKVVKAISQLVLTVLLFNLSPIKAEAATKISEGNFVGMEEQREEYSSINVKSQLEDPSYIDAVKAIEIMEKEKTGSSIDTAYELWVKLENGTDKNNLYKRLEAVAAPHHKMVSDIVAVARQSKDLKDVAVARTAVFDMAKIFLNPDGYTWSAELDTLTIEHQKVVVDTLNEIKPSEVKQSTIDNLYVLIEGLHLQDATNAGLKKLVLDYSATLDGIQIKYAEAVQTEIEVATNQVQIAAARVKYEDLMTMKNEALKAALKADLGVKLTNKEQIIMKNKKGYVYNTDFQFDLNVRSAPNLNGDIVGKLYNYNKIEILDTIVDASNNVWDKIIYNGSFAYVSDAYIQQYTSPLDDVVNVAKNITKQFEVGTSNQIAGNFDGQGLSLGYFQWCIGQGTLQPLLNRMDRQYNSEMRSIFGSNYDTVHNMILDTSENQLKWAKSINNSTNKIVEPWYSQFVSLSKDKNFISIEQD
ncbi:MAG: SH3 domain-containing protein [Clostridium sp.]